MHRALRGGDSPRLGHHAGTSVDAAHPYLNIHSASFTGNFGLVSYALTSGVPPSAVLDGITPLHAACANQASSNETVVNCLIDHGSDVNAARSGSRRASAENSRTPRVGGALGYTPLHFAVSAGHTSLIPILLAAGADPAIPDKHGMLPHHLAKQLGRAEAEALLMDALTRRASTSTGISSTPPPPVEKESMLSTSKRIAMKKSLENVLRHHPSSDTAVNAGSGFSSSSSSYNAGMVSGTRRPSLPDTSRRDQRAERDLPPSPPPPARSPRSPGPFPMSISHSSSVSPSISASASASSTTPTGANPDPGKGKRPRSAGAGAGGENAPYSEKSLAKKLGTKYSLLNVLRRNTEDSNQANQSEQWTSGRQMPSSITPGSGYPPYYPNLSPDRQRERKISKGSFSPSSPDSSHTPTLSTSPTATTSAFQYPNRPGILRTHRKSSSNSLSGNQPTPGSASPTLNPNSSAEVSRRPSTRTLRFEDQTPSPSVMNGGSWSSLPNGARKTSDASDRASSDYMMVRRPSDHSTSNSVFVEDEPDGTGSSTSLKRLALANSNRARAGTFSTIGTSGTGTSGELAPPTPPSAGSTPVDIPLPSKERMKGLLGSSPSGSPGIGSGLAGSPGIEGDPSVPDYSSDLSEEEEDEPVEEDERGDVRNRPVLPSKDGEGVGLQIRPMHKASAPAVDGARTNSATGYPGPHSANATDEEENAQYAHYEIDGHFEDYDEDGEPIDRSKGLWSSANYTYTPFSAPITRTGPGGGYQTRGGIPARSDSLPLTASSLGPISTSTLPTSVSNSSTPSISGPTSAQSQTFSIRSHREARHLVQQVQREILASAQAGSKSLSEQLAAYGETLAIERRFAIGEKQRWRNTAKEEDEEDPTGRSQDGDSRGGEKEGEDDESVEDVGEEDILEERAALRIRERERKPSNSIGRSSTVGSVRAKAGVRPKPKPLANRRPHTSSGVSGFHPGRDGNSPKMPSTAHHRSTRSVTAPIVPQKEKYPNIEIVHTVPTPPSSHSPASSLSNNEQVPSSYNQGYSFVPSSPLRRSLSENGEFHEGDLSPNPPATQPRNHRYQHHHNLSNSSTVSKSSTAISYGGLDTIRTDHQSHPIPVNLHSSNLPSLSPIMSESSGSAATFSYPSLNSRNNSHPLSASLKHSPKVPPSTASSFTPPSTLPPPPPHTLLERIQSAGSASMLDFGSVSSKTGMPRSSTASDRSGNSFEGIRTGLKHSGTIKGDKKSRFGGFKNFVQTIKGSSRT